MNVHKMIDCWRKNLFKNSKNIMSNRKDMILWNVEKSKILILCRTNKRMANFREREKICWTLGMLQILTSRVCKKNTYFSILCQYVFCIHCHFAPWTHENKYVFCVLKEYRRIRRYRCLLNSSHVLKYFKVHRYIIESSAIQSSEFLKYLIFLFSV